MRGRLAAVFAHPDDDAYTIGGTLLLNDGRVDVTIVLCTSGGNGPIWEPVAVRETLARVRESEQAAWCEAIGLSDPRVEFLRYTDGFLPQVPFEELVRRIEGILREARPHVVVTFGPDGMTRHPDHVRAGEATTEAFHRIRGGSGAPSSAFKRLLYVAVPRSGLVEMYRAIRERHLPFGDEDTPLNPVGVSEDDIAVEVDVTEVYERKIDAIRVHRSQIGELDRLPRDLLRLYLGRECFVQAWPRWEPGSPVATDPFDGLDGDFDDA